MPLILIQIFDCAQLTPILVSVLCLVLNYSKILTHRNITSNSPEQEVDTSIRSTFCALGERWDLREIIQSFISKSASSFCLFSWNLQINFFWKACSHSWGPASGGTFGFNGCLCHKGTNVCPNFTIIKESQLFSNSSANGYETPTLTATPQSGANTLSNNRKTNEKHVRIHQQNCLDQENYKSLKSCFNSTETESHSASFVLWTNNLCHQCSDHVELIGEKLWIGRYYEKYTVQSQPSRKWQ